MQGVRAAVVAALLAAASAQFFPQATFPRFPALLQQQPITFPTFPPIQFPGGPGRPIVNPGGPGGQGNQQLVHNCRRIQTPRGERTKPAVSDSVPTVVGGINARNGDWPWMVLVGEQIQGSRRWTCGGTLISANAVLTAAHCVFGRQPSAMTARLGEHHTGRLDDGRHVDAAVARIIIHPGYRHAHKQDDIALLVLSRPARFDQRVQPACLPPAGSDHTGQSAQVAGWGVTEFNGQPSRLLQQATLTVVDVHQCERSYQRHRSLYMKSFPGGFQGTKLCAADQGKASCRGDSGGPLTVSGADSRSQVIGVVSIGFGCGVPEFPGIYTKVSQYIPWIMQNAR